MGVPRCLLTAFLNDAVDGLFRIWVGNEFHNFVVAGTKEFLNDVMRFAGSVCVSALRSALSVSCRRVLGMIDVMYAGICDCGRLSSKYMASLWMLRRVFSKSQPNSCLSLSVDVWRRVPVTSLATLFCSRSSRKESVTVMLPS